MAGQRRRQQGEDKVGRWHYAAAAIAASQALVQGIEVSERRRLYDEAEALSGATGRPMLLVGMPRPYSGQYPCSQGVTLDLDASVRAVCGAGGVVADVQDIPYPDGHFGAVAAFHVLEHLQDLESAQRAWSELWRVTATRVLVAYPRRWNLYAALLQPEHHLWVYPTQDRLHVTEREGRRRTAWVLSDGSAELAPS